MRIFILVCAILIAQEAFGQSCMVKEKATNKTIKCEFPFKYEGEIHNTCIDFIDVKDGKKVPGDPWCSTKVRGSEREHVSGGKHFGDCDSSCPGGPGYTPPISIGNLLNQKKPVEEETITVKPKGPSTFCNSDCQCDSYTWTNGNKILGNCASKDKNGALFCYISGSAVRACRDVQASRTVKNNDGTLKAYSYEACTTPPRHRCNVPGLNNPAAIGPSAYQNCDCQCDSTTWTDGRTIKGNCQSRDRKGAKFCYISGRATRACRDIQQSTFLKDNNGRFRYYSYEACVTPARNLCNQFLGDGDILSLQGALQFNTLGPLIKAGTRSPGTNSSETEQNDSNDIEL